MAVTRKPAARKNTAKEKLATPDTVRALTFWHGVTLASLAQLPVDLSVRQTAVLLQVYLINPPHCIKGLAETLDISKPAICRAADMLENAKLVKRARDRHDKRNVLLTRTVKGAAYLDAFAEIILKVSKASA